MTNFFKHDISFTISLPNLLRCIWRLQVLMHLEFERLRIKIFKNIYRFLVICRFSKSILCYYICIQEVQLLLYYLGNELELDLFKFNSTNSSFVLLCIS